MVDLFGQHIAPSILAADILNIYDEVKKVADAEILHIDVMDGHFAEQITFGTNIVKALREKTEALLDVHLMISNAEAAVSFAEAGADIVTVHKEYYTGVCTELRTVAEMREIAEALHKAGVKAGIAVNPATNTELIKDDIEYFDMVLIMSVVAGLGGQEYISGSERRIRQIREMKESILIEVDGGINKDTILLPVNAGADIIVAGTSIFGADDAEAAYSELRELVNRGACL